MAEKDVQQPTLVNRLYQRARELRGLRGANGPLLCDAADEIVRLTEELADANQQLGVLRPGGSYAWKSKYEALAQEIARLKALAQAVMCELDIAVSYTGESWPRHDLGFHIAACAKHARAIRQALSETQSTVCDA